MLGTALTAAALSGAIVVGLSSPVLAQQYFDDSDAAGANDGIDAGGGVWDNATTNWTDDAAGPDTNAAYDPTPGVVTVFGAGPNSTPASAGTVTVDAGGVTLTGTVNFNATGDNSIYTVTGGGLTVAAGGTTINITDVSGDAGIDAQIDSTIDGADDLTTAGAGNLGLGGAIGGTVALSSVTLGSVGTTLSGGVVNTTGVQTYNTNLTLGANEVLTSTGAGAITFNGTTDGGFDLTVNTGGTTTFAGDVGGTTPVASLTTDTGGTTAINTGAITTSGAQTYNDVVTLGADTTLTGVGVTFADTVDGAQTLTVTDSGTTTFGGAVGGGTPLTSLTTNGGGTTAINGGAVTTTGSQTYNDAVTLGAATTLTGVGVTFGSTLNGAQTLTVTDSGTTTFSGVVGGTTPLTSLLTNGGGTTAINTTAITTSGAQTYNDAVTLGANTTLSGVGVTFGSTVNGAQTLTVTDSGTTTFSGVVGGATPLTSLTTNGGGTTAINTTAITTSGAQTYNDAVTLGANTTLTGVGITFGSTVNGAQTLTVTDSGTTTFSGIVGGGTPLTSLTTNGGGTTAINTTAITTSGAQTYNDAVTLGANTTLNGVGITFGSTVNGARSLTVTDSGTTTFNGVVGGTTPLAALTTNGGGTTAINGGAITTSGAQTYNDAVTLGAATTLTSTAGSIDATSTVNNGGFNLTVSNATTGTFAGAISGGGGFTKQGAGTITLSAANTYTGATTVSGGTLTISAAGSITSNVTNSATFNNNGGVTGTVSNSGTFTNGATGTVSGLVTNIAGTATNNGTFNGGANVTGGTLTNNLTINGGVTNSATFANAATGTVNGGLNNSGTATNAGAVNNGLTNSGTYTQTAGTTASGTTNTGTINANGGAFNGTVNNNAGSFNVAGAVTSNGIFANGAVLNINSGSYTIGTDLNNTGTVLISSGATLNVIGNINSTGGSITNNGTVNDDLFNSAPSVITNNATWNGNVATNTGTINNFGTWNGNVLTMAGQWNAAVASPGGSSTLNGSFNGTGGTINMQDADTQDVFNITGALTGTGTISADLDLGDGGVGGPQLGDKIVVGGAYTGAYNFDFRNLGASQNLQPDIVVADLNQGAANTGTFTATGLPNAGLIQYQLVQDGANGDWVVRSAGNPGALGGIAGNIAVVQSTIGAIVNRPSSPFVSGLAVDVDPNYCAPGPWMRATGGGVKARATTSAPPTFVATSEVSLGYAGVQFGLDLACFNVKESGFDVAAGIIGGGNAGISSQPVASNGSTTNANFKQGFGGAYVTVGKGGFSADLQARIDVTDFTFDNPTINLSNSKLTTTRGTISGSASYAIPVKDFNLVPTAGFSFSRTTGSSLAFTSGQTLTPDASLSLVGFVGATLAKTIVLPDEVSAITPFGTATVYNDFAPDPTATFFDPGTGVSQSIVSSHLGTIGEVSLGLNYVKILDGDTGPKQINATIRADARFSNRVLGAGLTGQVRAQF